MHAVSGGVDTDAGITGTRATEYRRAGSKLLFLQRHRID
jgi:hypothetical protein